jgi:HEAT repeat protein
VTDVERWLEGLGDERKAVQRPSAEALARAIADAPEVRERVVALLAAPAFRRRWGAAYALALAEPEPREAWPVLLEALGTDDGDVRWAAANLVARIVTARPELMPRLRELVGAEVPLARKMALYCLRDAGARDAASRDVAVGALADPDPAVRLAALSAAASISAGDADVARRVAALVADADRGVARAAAATLGRLGADVAEVRAALVGAGAGDDEALGRAARTALSRLDVAGSANRR